MSEKQTTVITIVALVLILLAGGGGIYYLHFVILEEKKTENAKLEKIVADYKAKKAKIRQLQMQIADLEKTEADKIQQIPNLTKQEYDEFANNLDKLRRQAGVQVSRAGWMVPAKPAPVPGRQTVSIPQAVHKVQYDLSVTGTFYQLLRYVNLLEQQRRFIGVQTFSIGRGGSDASEKGSTAKALKRDLKVTIYSYTYKLPDAAVVIEIPETRSGKSTDIPD
jgi:Tfp pilus assembly protein PilO